MKRRLWIVSLLCLLIIVAGCSKDTVTKEENNENVDPVEEAEIQPQPEVTYKHVYPLTGIPTNESVDQRVVAVMVNNHPKARPQSGVYKADIVYEILAEGNITRFLALFQSEKPDVIGPVRSARDYFIHLSKGYDALYIAHGYSPEAKEMLEAGVVDQLNGMKYDGSLFWRSNSRVAPHNSYISFENIAKGADENGYSMTEEIMPLPFLDADEVENLQGNTAKDIMVSYSKEFSTVEFLYDEQIGKYKRYNGGEQTVDLETETPVLLDNIFIVETEHRIIDTYGRRDIDFTSGGSGYLIQKGIAQKVQWENIDGKILPFKNGEEMGFVPGKTWINVIPTNPGLAAAVSIQ